MERVIEPRNSCEFSINARGKWSGKVKVYALTPERAFELALERAELLALLVAEKNESD